VFLSSGRIQVSELAELLTAVRARVREALSYADVRVLPIAAEDFPRTTSGKVRRGRLRELLAAGSFASLEDEVARVCADAAAFSACPSRPKQRSTRDVESVIIDIWAQVLEVPADTIGRNDRFLAIGGSSLAAMQVLGALEEAFGGPLNPSVPARVRHRRRAGRPLPRPRRCPARR
jgi:acyl carrier protein